MSTRLRKPWKPKLFRRELYSEILNHKFTITVTARALDLIDAAFGFDFYILKVSKCYLFCVAKLQFAFYQAVIIQLFLSDTEGRPELQAGDGPEESHVASPGAQRHRALPLRPRQEREGLQ